MIKWNRLEKKLPKVGSHVWILDKHWKNRGILSCQIKGMEVFESLDGQGVVFENIDDRGQGSERMDMEEVEAWADASQINID